MLGNVPFAESFGAVELPLMSELQFPMERLGSMHEDTLHCTRSMSQALLRLSASEEYAARVFIGQLKKDIDA